MVVRNKLYRIIDKYRNILKSKKTVSYETKNEVLDFYLKNSRWPNRRSNKKTERLLGQRFENFVSKESGSYDSHFRRLAMATGRTTNNKRKHNKAGFKQEILDFIKEHKRTPQRRNSQIQIEGENNLRSKLDRYILTNKDMSLLGKVYELDRCHRSGIPGKFRPIINAYLEIDKPLIRLVKE